jgi:hypothetical protein
MQAAQWIIAVITAVFVSVVAFLQWRTAQQKAVLDLFDRRHGIYEIVRKAVSTMTSNSNAFDQGQEIEFMQAMERAYFFFGDDVVNYLQQLWSSIMDVWDADKEMADLKDPTAGLDPSTVGQEPELTSLSSPHRGVTQVGPSVTRSSNRGNYPCTGASRLKRSFCSSLSEP